jgi:neutral ceramidase
MRERSPTLDYEVQVLRVGETAVVGLPGEPFVELGLAIKLASPTYPTYIAHCTSHYVGYIPTPEALTRGGHEVNTRYWAKLVPEAFDLILATATETLEQLFGGQC